MTSEIHQFRPSGAVEWRDSAGLLHDLGHGLFTLSCLSESLLATERVPAWVRHQLSLIADETERLLELVQHAAGDVAEPRPVAVLTMLDAIAEVAQHTSGTEVTVRPGAPVWLVTDELSLWRIVTNLVGNAVRAAGQGGLVELSAEQGPPVAITVADNGPGFGIGPHGWTGQGLRVVSEAADAGGAVLHFGRRSPHGTSVRLEFTSASPNAAGVVDGHTSDR
ncbi:sensor histidine kinase [Lentzea nigeriaca]|uniref:sensor histidine kinase n=1 Tax=Lentzea nigeriaca TaxID=1128665 RepID=UPI00195B130A|nr:HAMP domain-containing sensor histidine kinase [Lentzea nigeriaca]MBM7857182.1 signal transduction histidine kinase [Lentzea nigeriaca]